MPEALGEGNGLGGALNFLGWGDAGAEAGGHQGQVQGGYQSITFDDELAESKAFNKNDITITFPEDLQGDTKAQANGKGDDNANSVSGDDNEVQSAEGEKGAVVANLNSNAAMAEKGGNAAAGNANVFESFNVEQVNDTHLKTHNSGAPVMNIAKAYAGDAEGGDAEFENEADMGNKGYTGRNETEAENEHVDAGAGAEGENEDLGIGNSSANAGSGNLTAGDSDARAGSNMRADSEADANGGDVASEAWTESGDANQRNDNAQSGRVRAGDGGRGGNTGQVFAWMGSGNVGNIAVSNARGIVGVLANTGINANQLQTVNINANASFN